MRECNWCKNPMPETAHPNAKFHPDCRKESDRKKRRDHERRTKGYVRHPNCDWCGGPIPAEAPYSWKLCGDDCRKELREFHFQAARERNRKTFNDHCSECGGHIPKGAHPNAKYCGDECRKEVKTRRFKEFYRNHPERYQDYSAVRRATIKDATVERVEREKVFDRDGWVCHICGGDIDRAAEWPSSECVSLDHVVPLSRGGEHSYANCKTAHWGCNSSKSNKLLDELQHPMVQCH